MWGVAQIKYANENSWSRGVVSLDTPGWVHLITYPRESQGEDMVMMSYPAANVEHIEWLEVHTTSFSSDGGGLKAAKVVLDKYRHALYPQGTPDQAPTGEPQSFA